MISFVLERVITLTNIENKLFINAKEYIDEENLNKIESALEYAREFGSQIKSHDGSSFLDHATRTAIILTELHSDTLTIVSSLVWWVPLYREDISYDSLKEKFGEKIYDISISLSKMSALKLKDNLENSAITQRKILVGLATDVRVIIIKLSSRLDNLRTVYTEPSDIQKEKCLETENVFIPIAHRLGINYIKSELEDLCLKYLKPDAYNEILELLNASYEVLNTYIDTMKNELSKMLEEEHITFKIKGRVKSVHSLYEKLSKGKRWKDIYDVLALRIIVKKESECYLAIGLIHSKYRPIPKRFKDYIAQPKENMYQSLHTGVIGPNGRIFEIQIRTEEMDEIAECGVASHWSYKEHGSKSIQNLMEQKLELFRETYEMSNDKDDEVEKEFTEVFMSNMVYVFTPQGEVVELPEGSTPVDFAYKIHSHIGNTMVGAIVNDEIVQLDYKLKNNDIVKINTNESSKPNVDWLKFIRTSQAKKYIKSYYNKQDRIDYLTKGEETLNKEIRNRKLSINEVLSSANLEKLKKNLNLSTMEDIYLAIGSLKFTAKYIVNALIAEESSAVDAVVYKISTSHEQSQQEDYKNDIIVEGCDNIVVTIANCCRPVYGDPIVGYITKGNGITVHKESCKNLINMDERFIDVTWSNKPSGNYLARLIVRTKNAGNNNILDIATKSSQRNLYIDSIATREYKDHVDYEITVKVPNIDILKLFINDLEGLEFVLGVEREIK